METKRNYHFDNIKAFLIFLVVFGHLIEPLRDIPLFKSTYFIIYSFHMPLFILISGYFSKPSTKGIGKLLKLLLKYEIIYAVIYFLLFSSSGQTSGSILDFITYALQPIWVLWFLLSLVFWRLLLIAYEKHPIAIVIIVTLIVGFNFVPFNFRILSLGRTLSFFPYFLIGYLAKKHHFDFEHLRRDKTFVLYFGGLLIAFWAMFSGSVSDDMLYGATSLTEGNYSLFAHAAFKLNSYLIALAASIIVFNLIPSYETIYSKIGPRTLPIYLLHPIIIWCLIKIGFFNQLRDFRAIFTFAILLVLGALITLLLKDRKV